MPSSYTEITFETPFVDDINDQSHCIVVTWPDLRQRSLGILGKLQKISALEGSAGLRKVVVEDARNLDHIDNLDRKYKASFLGLSFVTL